MAGVLLLAGILCLLTFVILCLKKVDFCIIWLILAVLFSSMGAYLVYRYKNPAGYHLPGFFVTVFLTILALIVLSFVIVEGMIISGMFQKTEEVPEYVIVLGAQVKKRNPSRALLLRLKKAAEYLKKHPQVSAVLSGGQGDGEEISEAACMYQYLLDAGIEDERLLLEDMSTTTKENLELSAAVIERSQKLKGKKADSGKECKVGLISNNFHMFRAVRLARKQGYSDVFAIPASSDWRLQIHYMVREYFAILKATVKREI